MFQGFCWSWKHLKVFFKFSFNTTGPWSYFHLFGFHLNLHSHREINEHSFCDPSFKEDLSGACIYMQTLLNLLRFGLAKFFKIFSLCSCPLKYTVFTQVVLYDRWSCKPNLICASFSFWSGHFTETHVCLKNKHKKFYDTINWLVYSAYPYSNCVLKPLFATVLIHIHSKNFFSIPFSHKLTLWCVRGNSGFSVLIKHTSVCRLEKLAHPLIF